jgi:release factor glutamine methyltransferase
VLRSASTDLANAGIEHGDHDALVLYAAAAGVEVSQVRKWIVMGEQTAAGSSAQIRDRFASFVRRRVKREPLQYIVGTVGFRYLEVAVGEGVFIPRPETETVVAAGIDWLRDKQIGEPLVVDLCAGTGVVGLSVASEIANSTVFSVEKDAAAFRWLEKNEAATQARYPSMHFTPVLADAGSAETLKELDGRVDCVISNPPYIPLSQPTVQPEVDRDPNLALYGGSADGMEVPIRVIRRSARLLRSGGYLVMEHDISQMAAMMAAFAAYGFSRVATHKDLTGRPRFTTGVRA